MSIETPKPRRIEWAGPEGWIVWADEDGCHVRTPKGSALEMPDVERLFSLWTHACAMTTAGHIPAPRPPTREEIREGGYWRAEQSAKRRAVRAVEAEFDPPTVAPF
jgi:hypothetical protein